MSKARGLPRANWDAREHATPRTNRVGRGGAPWPNSSHCGRAMEQARCAATTELGAGELRLHAKLGAGELRRHAKLRARLGPGRPRAGKPPRTRATPSRGCGGYAAPGEPRAAGGHASQTDAGKKGKGRRARRGRAPMAERRKPDAQRPRPNGLAALGAGRGERTPGQAGETGGPRAIAPCRARRGRSRPRTGVRTRRAGGGEERGRRGREGGRRGRAQLDDRCGGDLARARGKKGKLREVREKRTLRDWRG
jgi:hypothetical protein